MSRSFWLLFAAVLSFSACTKSPRSRREGGQTGEKIVRLVMKDDVKDADPSQSNDQISAELLGHIFEGLMSFNYLGEVDKVSPHLAAAKPSFSDRNRTVTFKLRKGVVFQDDPAFPGGKGRELRADDFVFTIKRIADPRLGSRNWWMFDGLVEGLDDWRSAIEKAAPEARDELFNKPVAGLSAPKPNVFVIRLTKPYPQLLQILAMPQTAAMAREVVAKYGPEIISHPVGTGPFRLKSWIRGSKIIVERNPNYRQDFYPTTGSDEDRRRGLLKEAGKPIPFVKEIQWDIIKEEQPRWLKFRSGELDVTEIPKDNFLEAIGGDGELKPELVKEGVVLHKVLSLTSWWIEFNHKDPLLGQNIKLRQAIAHAFDRTRALEILYNNRGVLADSILPPSLEGGSLVKPWPYAFDVAKAQQLLAEAGYPEGKGLPELSFDLRGPGTTPRQLGEMIRDNLAKIGIRVVIHSNSFPEALEKAQRGQFQLMLGGWMADYPDPENFLQNFYSGNLAPGTNTSNFVSRDFDKLYEQIRTELPSTARAKKVAQAIEILQKEAVMVNFYHQMDYYVSWNWLKNYKRHILYFGSGRYLDLEY